MKKTLAEITCDLCESSSSAFNPAEFVGGVPDNWRIFAHGILLGGKDLVHMCPNCNKQLDNLARKISGVK